MENKETLEEALNKFKEEHTVFNLYPANVLQNIANFGAKWEQKQSEEVIKNLSGIIEQLMELKEILFTELEVHQIIELIRITGESSEYVIDIIKNKKEWKRKKQ